MACGPISIHALLTESDIAGRITSKGTKISIHALLTESDELTTLVNKLFEYFYPRSPYGERQENPTQKRETKTFLSTLSLRRATVGTSQVFQRIAISIHALLTESDMGLDGRFKL